MLFEPQHSSKFTHLQYTYTILPPSSSLLKTLPINMEAVHGCHPVHPNITSCSVQYLSHFKKQLPSTYFQISWMSHPWKGGKYGKQTVRWLETQSEKKTAAAEIHVNVVNGIILTPALFVSLCHYISSDLFCLSDLICTFAASLFSKARWGFKRQPFLIVVHPGISEPDRRVNTAWNRSHKPLSRA